MKTYLYHWVKALQALTPDTISTFLAPENTDHIDHDGGPRIHPLKIAALLSLNRLPDFFCGLAIPRCNIFHCSNLLRAVPRKPMLTATVHDLTPWIMPELHSVANVAADRMFAERVLKRAAGVIAVSENTKRDATRILGITPEKIRVIPLGVPPAYFSVTSDDIQRVKIGRALTKPYFLFVGTIEPRKNVDSLLTAWGAMTESFRQENQLVIAGMPGWLADSTMNRLIQANRDGEGVRYLGYVAETDLPGLTAGARAFVYPSLYEGFGIPVAQAMATGCPVITSNVSSLPEVTGGAALLIDPGSPAELSSAMLKLGESEELRIRLASEGATIARKYTWRAAAASSQRFFEEVS